MEFKDLRQKLEEAASVGEISPAAMLVLRRRGIRVFPDGQRVALYTNEKYNLTFMVPFGGQHPASSANPLMPMHEYVNVMGGLASAAAGLVKGIAGRGKAQAQAAKAQKEKQTAAHRANREKQLKRAMQNRQKRQHAELISALKNRQGNTP